MSEQRPTQPLPGPAAVQPAATEPGPGPAVEPLAPEPGSEPAPSRPPTPPPTPTTPATTGPATTGPATTGPAAPATTRKEPPESVLQPPAPAPVPPVRRPLQQSWQFWVVMALAAAVLLILAWFFVTAFLPRWWSQRIADIGEGHAEPSIAAGLTIGAVFTMLGLAALGFSIARGRSWRGRLLVLAGALVLAGPNLTTLGIVWGPSAGAQDGERALRTFAPGFLSASLSGAIIGAFLMIVIWIMYDRYRRRGVEIAWLRAELERRPVPTPSPGAERPRHREPGGV